MERIDSLIDRKQEIFYRYKNMLAGLPLQLNPEPPGTVNGFWMPTAVFAPEAGVTREKLQAAFSKRSIDARVFFHPLSSLPMFESQHVNQWAWAIPGRSINLPSYHDIAIDEQASVVAVIKKVFSDEDHTAGG
jgi:perosamine synthetase